MSISAVISDSSHAFRERNPFFAQIREAVIANSTVRGRRIVTVTVDRSTCCMLVTLPRRRAGVTCKFDRLGGGVLLVGLAAADHQLRAAVEVCSNRGL